MTSADRDVPSPFVAFSEITVPPAGRDRLLDAFDERLREVEHWPGFQRLEVWQDERTQERLVMVSWWDDDRSFKAYMRSDSHRRSHARIPGGDDRARPDGFHRFRVVSS
jgi:heme-degrading monooxygenase HmoA